MLTAARHLRADFLSTVLFLVVYAISGRIEIAILGIVAAFAIFAFWKIKGREPDAMQWQSAGLVLAAR